MQELRWYDRVETFTRPGLALMTVTLKDSTPPAEVPERVLSGAQEARRRGTQPAAGRDRSVRQRRILRRHLRALCGESEGHAAAALAREAETLRQRLLHVPGVKKVNIIGERPERIFVEFSYAPLATLGVSARSIFAALNRQNVVTPAGSIDTNGPQVFVRSTARTTICRKSATRRLQPAAACSSCPTSPR